MTKRHWRIVFSVFVDKNQFRFNSINKILTYHWHVKWRMTGKRLLSYDLPKVFIQFVKSMQIFAYTDTPLSNTSKNQSPCHWSLICIYQALKLSSLLNRSDEMRFYESVAVYETRHRTIYVDVYTKWYAHVRFCRSAIAYAANANHNA